MSMANYRCDSNPNNLNFGLLIQRPFPAGAATATPGRGRGAQARRPPYSHRRSSRSPILRRWGACPPVRLCPFACLPALLALLAKPELCPVARPLGPSLAPSFALRSLAAPEPPHLAPQLPCKPALARPQASAGRAAVFARKLGARPPARLPAACSGRRDLHPGPPAVQ